jgi:D-alanyl-D-alanine carboxypeptidase
VTTASKNGMDLTIVTLNVYDSYSVHRKLYEKYYETYEMTEIIKKGEYFLPNDYYDGKLKIVKSFYYPLTKQEKENVKTELYISKEATQKKINYVEIKLGDKKIGKIEVQNIKKKEDNNIFAKIKNYLLEILNKLMLGLQNNLSPAPLVPRPLEIYSFVSSS